MNRQNQMICSQRNETYLPSFFQVNNQGSAITVAPSSSSGRLLNPGEFLERKTFKGIYRVRRKLSDHGVLYWQIKLVHGNLAALLLIAQNFRRSSKIFKKTTQLFVNSISEVHSMIRGLLKSLHTVQSLYPKSLLLKSCS